MDVFLITLFLWILAVNLCQWLSLLPEGTNMGPRGQSLIYQALRVVLGSWDTLVCDCGQLGSNRQASEQQKPCFSLCWGENTFKEPSQKPTPCPLCGALYRTHPSSQWPGTVLLSHALRRPVQSGVRTPGLGVRAGCSPPQSSLTRSPLGKATITHLWPPHFLQNPADGVVFHLLDVPLPHLSPTVKICIYKTRTPGPGPGWQAADGASSLCLEILGLPGLHPTAWSTTSLARMRQRDPSLGASQRGRWACRTQALQKPEVALLTSPGGKEVASIHEVSRELKLLVPGTQTFILAILSVRFYIMHSHLSPKQVDVKQKFTLLVAKGLLRWCICGSPPTTVRVSGISPSAVSRAATAPADNSAPLLSGSGRAEI